MSARYPAFDSLRACMMLLGLVIHGALSYLVLPVPNWVIRDSSRHIGFDILVAWIHTFRMPVFFVVAGFFAHLLYERDGPRGFARNRALRIGLVLVLTWFPLLASLFVLIEVARQPNDLQAFREAISAIGTARFWGVARLAHLWFLYYLLLFCGVVLVLPHNRLSRAASWLTDRAGDAIRKPWHASLLLALPLAVLLTTMPMGFLATPIHPWPIHWPAFAAYLTLFGFGWFVYPQRVQLNQLRAPGNRLLAAGTGAVLAALPFVRMKLPHIAAIWIALATWLLVFGMLGFFLRYANRENAWMTYLSDASYFVYLAHLPVVFAGVIALRPLPWPALLKFLVLLTASTGLLLGAYHLFVRNTRAGYLLSRRRLATAPRLDAQALAYEPSVPSATPYP